MDTIKNATGIFRGMGVLADVGGGEAGEKRVKVGMEEGVLKGLERKVEGYLKSKYASSFKGTLGNGRGSVTLDFPFLSKL